MSRIGLKVLRGLKVCIEFYGKIISTLLPFYLRISKGLPATVVINNLEDKSLVIITINSDYPIHVLELKIRFQKKYIDFTLLPQHYRSFG